jgi:hypothetical protein
MSLALNGTNQYAVIADDAALTIPDAGGVILAVVKGWIGISQ